MPKETKEIAIDEGWCDAKIAAWLERDKRPNAYFYRFLPEGEKIKSGGWAPEELEKLKEICLAKKVNTLGSRPEWGIISQQFPGRVGYTCSSAYRKLVDSHTIEDPNYVFINGKSKYVYGARTGKADQPPKDSAPSGKGAKKGAMADERKDKSKEAKEEKKKDVAGSSLNSTAGIKQQSKLKGLQKRDRAEGEPSLTASASGPSQEEENPTGSPAPPTLEDSPPIRKRQKLEMVDEALLSRKARPNAVGAPAAAKSKKGAASGQGKLGWMVSSKTTSTAKPSEPEVDAESGACEESLEALGSARKIWKWESQQTFRRVQTMKDDQGARTPKWLLSYLQQTYGRFFDPAPANRMKEFNGLHVPWHSVNYINPPFDQTKAFLEKGVREARKPKGGVHSMYLIPCAKFHCKYFVDVFPTVSAVEILSTTIAFEGYANRLPHALTLLHVGKPARPMPEMRTQMRLLTVPAPSSFEQVRRMVIKMGYPQCYVLANKLSGPLEEIFNEYEEKKPDCLAILFPCRFENKWIHSQVLPKARGIFPCVGTLRPGDTDTTKVWSGSTLAIVDDNDDRFGRLTKHAWMSECSAPIASFNVPETMREYADVEFEMAPKSDYQVRKTNPINLVKAEGAGAAGKSQDENTRTKVAATEAGRAEDKQPGREGGSSKKDGEEVEEDNEESAGVEEGGESEDTGEAGAAAGDDEAGREEEQDTEEDESEEDGEQLRNGKEEGADAMEEDEEETGADDSDDDDFV